VKNLKDFLSLFSDQTDDNGNRLSTREKVFGLADLDPQILAYRVLPHFVAELARKYFRLEVEGLEHIPKRGPALLCPNHSGYSGFDALLLAHEVFKSSGRVPRVMTHHLWFLFKQTAVPAEKMGFIEANTPNAIMQLKKNNLVILFPEGEYGNFKPSSERYHLQEFKRGFVRMAIQRQCPIIPTLIIGAEETHINLAQLKFTKYLRGTVLPLPLNIIPLPARWKFVFLPPIELPYKPSAADDRELVNEIAGEIQQTMQSALTEQLSRRTSIFR
jgi:1-acyl-sn-glycerol-3-phosphate acyltransferase